MGVTDDHVQLNLNTTEGATIASDIINNNHYQIVKIAHGADGVSNDVTRSIPLPVAIEQRNTAYSNGFLAVAGSTDGTLPVGIAVSAGNLNVSVSSVGITHGATFQGIADGVSADIRSVVSGARFNVQTADQTNKVSVVGNVSLNAGSNLVGKVDINSVTLPSNVFSGSATGQNGDYQFGTQVLKSGIRIKNSGSANFNIGSYVLSPLESIYIECGNLNQVPNASGTNYDICWIAS